jgi:hypothetical protein
MAFALVNSEKIEQAIHHHWGALRDLKLKNVRLCRPYRNRIYSHHYKFWWFFVTTDTLGNNLAGCVPVHWCDSAHVLMAYRASSDSLLLAMRFKAKI